MDTKQTQTDNSNFELKERPVFNDRRSKYKYKVFSVTQETTRNFIIPVPPISEEESKEGTLYWEMNVYADYVKCIAQVTFEIEPGNVNSYRIIRFESEMFHESFIECEWRKFTSKIMAELDKVDSAYISRNGASIIDYPRVTKI